MAKVLLSFIISSFCGGYLFARYRDTIRHPRKAIELNHCQSDVTTANIAQSELLDYLVDNQMLTIFDANSARSYVDTYDKSGKELCDKLKDSNDN